MKKNLNIIHIGMPKVATTTLQIKGIGKNSETHFHINSLIVKEIIQKMKKRFRKEYLNRDEVNEMIESAIRRHNRRSTIISSVLGWILIGGYSFGLFQAVQNV